MHLCSQPLKMTPFQEFFCLWHMYHDYAIHVCLQEKQGAVTHGLPPLGS